MRTSRQNCARYRYYSQKVEMQDSMHAGTQSCTSIFGRTNCGSQRKRHAEPSRARCHMKCMHTLDRQHSKSDIANGALDFVFDNHQHNLNSRHEELLKACNDSSASSASCLKLSRSRHADQHRIAVPCPGAQSSQRPLTQAIRC